MYTTNHRHEHCVPVRCMSTRNKPKGKKKVVTKQHNIMCKTENSYDFRYSDYCTKIECRNVGYCVTICNMQKNEMHQCTFHAE